MNKSFGVVIQTTKGRKNLDCVRVDVFEILRFALNDKRKFNSMKKLFSFILLLGCIVSLSANPIKGLLERIDKGASKKFIIQQQKSPVDFFELDQKDDKVVVRGNNYVSIATGINWYLKYHAGIHLSWNGMTADLPEVLPAVTQKERHETNLPYRYAYNYCTFSYSMAFWDWAHYRGLNVSLV